MAVEVRFLSMTGVEISSLDVPRDATVADLMADAAPALPDGLKTSDVLVFDGVILDEPEAKPWLEAEPVVEVTVIYTDEIREGDRMFYSGPSTSEQWQRGMPCIVLSTPDAGSLVAVRSVDVDRQREVHVGHLSRIAPSFDTSSGHSAGDTLYYVGPPICLRERHLLGGMRGEFVEVGVVNDSWRVRFADVGEVSCASWKFSTSPPSEEELLAMSSPLSRRLAARFNGCSAKALHAVQNGLLIPRFLLSSASRCKPRVSL
mmetsp:Transcript_8918/g.23170  ORF Transcript_8918/g.23170 Transcript_8918/m.23170 type:complete len:260 (+) Transcript_8918:104-883(+)